MESNKVLYGDVCLCQDGWWIRRFLDSVTYFLKKRTFELLGLILVLSSVALAIAFTTYSPEDPSFIYGDRSFAIQNFFGIYGSSIADFLLQSFGLASFLLLFKFEII